MRRTIPLLITAFAGFALIISYFVPAIERLGADLAVWFDILAAIAFILGGGNLLKVHLRKVSDKQLGWGYSVVTLVAFSLTLLIGMIKFGVQPAPSQEFHGQSFASLLPDQFPKEFGVDAELPLDPSEFPFDATVRKQLRIEDGQVIINGWLDGGQIAALKNWTDHLEWQAAVEETAEAMNDDRKNLGDIGYRGNHGVLTWSGTMSDAERETLAAYSSEAAWTNAVEGLAEVAAATSAHSFTQSDFSGTAEANAQLDWKKNLLTVSGPMTSATRAQLETPEQFRTVRPLTPAEAQSLIDDVNTLGELTSEQGEVFLKEVRGIWNVDQLWGTLQLAASERKGQYTARQLLKQLKESGDSQFEKEYVTAPAVTLTDEQRAILEAAALTDLADDPGTYAEQLQAAGPWPPRVQGALETFISQQPTEAEFRKKLGVELLREGPLNAKQRELLFDDYQELMLWRESVSQAFIESQTPKYPLSGKYDQEGSGFWWCYEYLMKPLTATMFAMLGFYVASAAFRAFRAKNLEAVLLLGTAFIILLGRTNAGNYLTSWWLPESLGFLQFHELSIFIMQVFNTAGNRAIMIGIALGIVSTSLKVLLGIDRSYLAGGDD